MASAGSLSRVICRTAGYTTGAIYSNFPGKEELAWQRRQRWHVASLIDRLASGAGSAVTVDPAPIDAAQRAELYDRLLATPREGG